MDGRRPFGKQVGITEQGKIHHLGLSNVSAADCRFSKACCASVTRKECRTPLLTSMGGSYEADFPSEQNARYPPIRRGSVHKNMIDHGVQTWEIGALRRLCPW